MNIEINHSDVNIKEESIENENSADDNSKTDGFLYVDMNEYNENNFDGIDIKEEEEQVEYLLLEKNTSENSNICFEGTLPLNSLKNLANHSQNECKLIEEQILEKNDKKRRGFMRKPVQKENILLKTKVNIKQGENSKFKKYTLRERTWSQKIDSGLFESIPLKKKNVKRKNKAKSTNCLNFNSTCITESSVVSENTVKDDFKCLYCRTSFTLNSLLNAHLKVCKFKASKNYRSLSFNCKSSVVFNNHSISDNNLQNHKRISFRCDKCNQSFKKKITMISHILKNECSSEMYICALCDKTFLKKNILKKHIIAHLKNQIQCQWCFQLLKNSSNLKSHNCREEINNTSLYCECNKKFLQSKSEEIPNSNINKRCLKCNKLVTSKKFADNQLPDVNHCVISQFQICKKSFKDYVLFTKHLENHRDVDVATSSTKDRATSKNFGNTPIAEYSQNSGPVEKKIRYRCDICGKYFIKLVRLKIHILNIHQGITYQCKECHMKFPSLEDLDSHKNKEECKQEDLNICKTCGKVFAKRDYLKKHQYMHMNVLFKCKYCYCAFMKEKSYKKHIEKMNCSKSARRIRMTEFNYKKCRLCEIEYESEELLIKHFRVSHFGLEPHQCFCCDSCLPSFQELQNHIHQHNIQKYTCNLCGKPYTSQEGFRKHRLKHKGAEFKCKFCLSEFLNENRFKFHEKTCKKNPESCHEFSQKKEISKKKDKPKQSRQLHWESRIIMKRLRGDPTSFSGDQKYMTEGQHDNFLASTFFDEPENEKTNERGWFDNYYKTEEDDIAFGLKKTDESAALDCNSGPDITDFLRKESLKKKKTTLSSVGILSANKSASTEDCDLEPGADSSENSSSESDSEIHSMDLPIDYNPKKCRLCIISFSQEYELLHHFIKSHPGEFAHKCPQCGIQSPLYAQLKEHMKNHGIGIGIFNCDNCSKQFKSEKKLSSHNIRCKGIKNDSNTADIRLFSQSGEDSCKRCGKKFHTKFGYRRHKQLCKKYKIKNPMKLQTIPTQSGTKPETVNGLTEGDNFQFSDLEEELKPGSDAASVKSKTSLEQEPNSTKLISSVSAKPSEEKTKIETKNTFSGEPPLDSFPCRLCEKKFQYERGIVMHFKTSHPGNKPLICHVCNMHLADKLKEHLKTHGIGEEFVCELCGKRFNQKFLSKIHEMWHQGIEYKCNNCKQKFLNKEKMEKHIGENRCSNRQSLMRLPCDICGKSYRSKFGLSKHYITHTPKELRPVKNRMNCEYCGKWFENNNGLQRHRRIHTGERPFCCRFCPKAFAQEGNCKAHERIHTGEAKPRKKKLSAITTPSSRMPPHNSLVSQVSTVPSFSLSSSATDSISYSAHVNICTYNNVDLGRILS